MDEIASLDALAQAELVRRGETTPLELVHGAIERIERLNPTLNAVVTPIFDRALDAAAKTLPDGQFTGVPYLLKDLAVEQRGVRFTEGSRFLVDNVSTHDQELTRRLERSGLVILGKTNTPEFGMRPVCEPALFGPTRNPWDTARTPGGSSGGSAAAVASGMVPIADASDLGGSIRYPASCCGLFGLKPSRARNPFGPEYGDVVNGLAVEHAITRSVRDSAALLDATAGPAIGDPYWAPPAAGPFADEVGAEPGRLRIAFSDTPLGGYPAHPDCVAAVRDAAALCDALGHELVEATPPGIDTPEFAAAVTTVIGAAISWIVGYWVRRVGRDPGPDELEPYTRALWHVGRRITAADYLLAVEHLQRVSRGVAEFLGDRGLWLTPTLAQPPLRIGELEPRPTDPLAIGDRSGAFVAFPGILANITGGPAMSVPLSWNACGLPIGVHFLGHFGDEATLFRLAAQLEAAHPWAGRRPPVFTADMTTQPTHV